MLNSLPKSYKEVKAAIKFGRKSITLNEVISALRPWEMGINVAPKANRNGESLNIRGRQKEKNQNKARWKSRSKSRNHGDKWWKNVKCYSCQEVGHTKKFCPKRNKKGKEQEKSKGEVVVAQDGYESANVLVVSTSEFDKKWILDYGFSFHMTPNKDWFESFKYIDGGQVILGNNSVVK